MRWMHAGLWVFGLIELLGCSSGGTSDGTGYQGDVGLPTATGGTNAGTGGGSAGTSPTGGAGGTLGQGGASGTTGGVGGTGGSGGAAGTAGSGGFAGVSAAGTGAAGTGAAGTGSTTNLTAPPADKLPQVVGSCPTLSTGSVTVAGATARIWVGSKPGPAYFYFHGTGTSPSEVDQGLPGATAGVAANGGLVASWETSNGTGINTGTIWYTGDLDGVDQIVACGIEQGVVDPARIHVSGFSAGGLETGAAVFGRSAYVASVVVYSGGKPFGAGAIQDPGHVPAVLGAHGAKGMDALGLDFHDGTIALENEIVGLGGFAIDCDDGGDHVFGWITRAGVGGQAVKFLQDHPYGANPSPYEGGGLPAGYPSYCTIVK